MENLYAKIEMQKSEISNLGSFSIENKKKLEKKLRLEFNFNSNHLEGNTLTYGETELLLIFDQTQGVHMLREYEEMKAHDAGINYIKELAVDPERVLTEVEIKNINKIILVKDFWKDAITPDGSKTRRQIKVGEYKAFPNSVRLSNGEIFEYASVSETPLLMADLVKWLNETLVNPEVNVLQTAALLHYNFVRIHPFDDGNGRIARLLMNYVFYKFDYPPVIIKSKEKKDYLRALNYADSGDFEAFIRFIGDQLFWSFNLYKKAQEGLSLEEADDLDKEIEIFKRQARSKNIEAPHRNNRLVKILFDLSLERLIKVFQEKHEQFFELFNETRIILTLDSHVYPHLAEKIHAFEDDKDEIKRIDLIISMSEYKSSEEPFHLQSVLEINFEPYKYLIKSRRLGTINKLSHLECHYNQIPNGKQIDDFVAQCLTSVFDDIKSKG